MNQETEHRLSIQPPGPGPGVLTMYPGCTPRPRNQRAYAAACAAANGELVQEFNASQVMPRMRAWCNSSFLTVINAEQRRVSEIDELSFNSESARNHWFVVLRLEGDGATTGWLIGELDAPVYCLA